MEGRLFHPRSFRRPELSNGDADRARRSARRRQRADRERSRPSLLAPPMHPGILGLKQRMPSAMPPTRSSSKGNTMNWDTIEGNWKQFKGHVQEKWGKLTDDNLDAIAGKREQLAGKIEETYR